MIKQITCGKVNCYIAGEPGSAVLVDTATPRYAKKLYKAALAAGVKLIVLTHAHYDHAGGAAELSERLGVPVAMSQPELNVLKGGEPEKMSAHTFSGKTLLRVASGNLKKRAVLPVRTEIVTDGDMLSSFGGAGEIIALGGHTSGSTGVLYGDSLIAGDARSNIFKPSCIGMYSDRASAEATVLRILTDPRIVRVYVGHGSVIELDKLRESMTPAPVADF